MGQLGGRLLASGRSRLLQGRKRRAQLLYLGAALLQLVGAFLVGGKTLGVLRLSGVVLRHAVVVLLLGGRKLLGALLVARPALLVLATGFGQLLRPLVELALAFVVLRLAVGELSPSVGKLGPRIVQLGGGVGQLLFGVGLLALEGLPRLVELLLGFGFHLLKARLLALGRYGLKLVHHLLHRLVVAVAQGKLPLRGGHGEEHLGVGQIGVEVRFGHVHVLLHRPGPQGSGPHAGGGGVVGEFTKPTMV